MIRIQVLAIFASLLLMLLTVELIRKRHLEEKYALTWLTACVFFFLCSLNVKVLSFLADISGVLVPSNFIFLLGFFFLTVISLSLSVIVSKESLGRRRLVQELSLLRFELEEMRNRLGEGESTSGTAPYE